MYVNTKNTGRPYKARNRFPEIIQECYDEYMNDLAVGEKINLPYTIQIILRLNDVILSRHPACLSAIRCISAENALEELDTMGCALIRASKIIGYDTEGLALSVCRSTYNDFSHAVGVATCVSMLTPGATFRDFAGLRRSIAKVFDTFYGNIGCTTPYQSGRSDMYLTKYMSSCAKSVLGLYAYIPAVLSHFDKGVFE